MKNILITGGTRGIGKYTADLLRAGDWNVFAVGRQSVDLTSSLRTAVYLKEFHANVALDAIVFSHGKWFSGDDTFGSEHFDQYVSRVLMPIEIIRHFATHLRMSSVGAVVFVSSTRGFIGGVDTAPYSLACAAQIALVHGYAREFSKIKTVPENTDYFWDVRFNCVCPGLTDTDMGRDVIRTGGAKATAVLQSPESVAQEIVKLIEDKTANGKIIRVVDGLTSEAKWTW